jgi:two-component system chemotaxis sensor kinase CheA
MEKVLVALESGSGGAGPGAVDDFFRAAHSIKGMAASMGYQATTSLAHALEDLMEPVRSGAQPMTRAMVDLMLAGVDRLRELVDAVEASSGTEKGDAAALVARIRDHLKSAPLPVLGTGKVAVPKEPKTATPAAPLAPQEPPPPVAPPPGPSAAQIAADAVIAAQGTVTVQIEIAPTSRTPAVRGYLVHKRLAEIGTIVRMVPSLEDVKRGNFDRKLLIELGGSAADDAIRAKVTGIPEVVRVEIRRGDKPVDAAAAAEAVAGLTKPADRTLRIPAQLLDSLIDGVGEILTLRHTLRDGALHANNPRLIEAVTRLDRVAQDMHRGALQARLSPIGTIMERMPRTAREVARLSGKEVDVEISGGEIEIDRAILEEIHGSIVHVIRNAVDHGVETAEDRVAIGKGARGRVNIKITRERDFVSIAIADDGRGIDPVRLKRVAYERGLIDEKRASEMDDREALRLICLPGFSTAERVTEISGRGVGMDVVKTTVEGFGGEFEIESVIGKGTTISMRLPRTIALVQVLLAHTGEEMYAVPLNKILRSIEVAAADVKAVPKGSAIEVAGELIPMRPLAEALGRPVAARMTADLRVRALVIEGRGKKAALAVDEIAGVEEVVVKPLGMPLRRIEGVAGITRVGDGRPVFLLDPQKLL